MNIFSIHKALLAHLESIAGLPDIFPEGSAEKPDPSTEYLEEFVLTGPTNSVGIANDSSNIMRGIYQVDLNYPKGQGKFNALKIMDTITLAWPKGLVLTHDGQRLKVGTTSWSPVRNNDLSCVVSLSVQYVVIG